MSIISLIPNAFHVNDHFLGGLLAPLTLTMQAAEKVGWRGWQDDCFAATGRSPTLEDNVLGKRHVLQHAQQQDTGLPLSKLPPMLDDAQHLATWVSRDASCCPLQHEVGGAPTKC